MPLGILEDTHMDPVPGTVYILDSDATDPIHHKRTDLKYDKTGTIILVPQPSNDPNDPLNWPIWHRDLVLFIISLLAVIASSLSPILAADTLSLSVYYRTPFTRVALLTGWHLLGVGIGGLFFVPSSRIWGKRHAFLIGNIIIIISAAWNGGSAHNFESAAGARFFQGVGLAPFEGLLNAVVGDLYHVHERGSRMALTNFCVFGGSFLTPVIAGRIARTIGWSWTFYFIAIFASAMFPFMIFFAPETAYRRDDKLNTDLGNIAVIGDSRLATTKLPSREQVRESESPEGVKPGATGEAADGAEAEKSDPANGNTGSTDQETTPIPPKFTYWQSLKIFNGRKTDEGFIKLFFRPFPLLFHPAIMWSYLIQGTLIGWTVFIGVCLAAILISPPLFFNEEQTGYMYTGAFIGAVVGFLIAGVLAETVPRFLTKLNKGKYEPEFRLPLVLPQLILGCAGLWGFGIVSNDVAKYGWLWPAFFFALEVAGMVIGAVASSLYIIDAHRNIAIEAFTCMLVFKNLFSFALCFKAYDWLVSAGSTPPIFKGVTIVQIVICCLTIPMYVFGKRNRSYFARHDMLKKVGLW